MKVFRVCFDWGVLFPVGSQIVGSAVRINSDERRKKRCRDRKWSSNGRTYSSSVQLPGRTKAISLIRFPQVMISHRVMLVVLLLDDQQFPIGIIHTPVSMKRVTMFFADENAKGMYVGAPCEFTCHAKLHHVYCDPSSNTCSCEKDYVVLIGLLKGCAKPKKLGEQCFYDQTCIYNDEHALCVQISHNAICQCAPGFHSVSYVKPTRRVFCTQDMAQITADLPTLFGVTSGIAVLAGLICMVLHLFSKTKYPRPRHFGDANLAPPILYNSDTGSRRPSLASVHSTTSSVRSYSMRRFEQEIQQKELRQEMKKHLVRLQEQQQLQKIKPNIIIGDVISCPMNKPILTTPSPMTPNSIDDLLPSVDETQEFSPNLSQRSASDSMCGGYDGPCSSTELLK